MNPIQQWTMTAYYGSHHPEWWYPLVEGVVRCLFLSDSCWVMILFIFAWVANKCSLIISYRDASIDQNMIVLIWIQNREWIRKRLWLLTRRWLTIVEKEGASCNHSLQKERCGVRINPTFLVPLPPFFEISWAVKGRDSRPREIQIMRAHCMSEVDCLDERWMTASTILKIH